MAKSDTIFVNANGTVRARPTDLLVGEVLKRAVDWNAYLGSKSTTISSSSWAADGTGTVSVGSATNSGGVTGATFTAGSVGRTTAKNTVVLANGETLVRKFVVTVTDPLIEADDYP